MEGAASSSMAGRQKPIKTQNQFNELYQAKLAEEVANKADQEQEEQEMLQRDQGRRNDALANRKRQWHTTKRQQEAGPQDACTEH
eukprot:7173188-Heterocapsa_arctica.AAC.1